MKRLYSIKFERKVQDCWIGVYWRNDVNTHAQALHIWICLLPVFPLHMVFI